MNVTLSPTEAVTFEGEKARPLLPTWTWISAAETVEARVARMAVAREKCILIIFFLVVVFRLDDPEGVDDNLV